MDLLQNNSWVSLVIHGSVVLIAAIVAITSFALLIPLDSVQAVSGVSIILGVTYGLSVLAWLIVLTFYSSKPDTLMWINTHLMFLVVLLLVAFDYVLVCCVLFVVLVQTINQ
jgi:hypothetical protein